MKIYASTIAWRAVEIEHLQSVLDLCRTPNMIYEPQIGDALIERARSIVATRFLYDTDCDVLLTMDSDIIFARADALKLCEQAMEHDVVCGLYVTRRIDKCVPTSYFNVDVPVEIGHQRLTPLRWGASGFMAVARRVIEKLAQDPEMPLCHEGEAWRFHPFYLPFVAPDENGRPILLSEDYAFTQRAIDAGFGVWLNAAVDLHHKGAFFYNWRDLAKHDRYDGPMVVTRKPTGVYNVLTIEKEEQDARANGACDLGSCTGEVSETGPPEEHRRELAAVAEVPRPLQGHAGVRAKRPKQKSGRRSR